MRRDSFGGKYIPTSASVPTGVSIRAGLSTRPRTTIAAACSALIAGIGLSLRDGAIIGVSTSGMWMLVNVMWSDSVSVPTTSEKASSAALLGMYALYFGLLACTPALDTFTT